MDKIEASPTNFLMMTLKTYLKNFYYPPKLKSLWIELRFHQKFTSFGKTHHLIHIVEHNNDVLMFKTGCSLLLLSSGQTLTFLHSSL